MRALSPSVRIMIGSNWHGLSILQGRVHLELAIVHTFAAVADPNQQLVTSEKFRIQIPQTKIKVSVHIMPPIYQSLTCVLH